MQIGAGLQCTPNSTKIFKQLGVYEVLEPKAAEPAFLQVRRYYDGKVLSRTDDFNLDMRKKYDAPFWDLHRVDVQVSLFNRARELGVNVCLARKVTDVDFESPSLKLESGETLTADLIVAADGLWSKCRERFLASKGQSDSPLPTGDLAYRIVLKFEDIDDAELRAWVSKPSCQFWIGPGSHAVAYSLRDGKEFNLVLLVPDDLPANIARKPGSLDEMRQLFANWDPVLNKFLDQVKTVDKWKLMHRPELESWVSENSNFVFIGDSCHPMLPCPSFTSRFIRTNDFADDSRPRSRCQLVYRRWSGSRLYSRSHRIERSTARCVTAVRAIAKETRRGHCERDICSAT